MSGKIYTKCIAIGRGTVARELPKKRSEAALCAKNVHKALCTSKTLNKKCRVQEMRAGPCVAGYANKNVHRTVVQSKVRNKRAW